MVNIKVGIFFRFSIVFSFKKVTSFDVSAKKLNGNKKQLVDVFFENNSIQYSDSTESRNDEEYYLTTKYNLYIGYNNSEEWRLAYYPYKRYKYFFNLNYQFYTSYSPEIASSTYGLLNEIGINSTQIYYKLGLIYHFNKMFYLNTNMGLSYTFNLGGYVINDLILGVKLEVQNNVFLQIEGGANSIINIGLPFNPFLKIGLGFDL